MKKTALALLLSQFLFCFTTSAWANDATNEDLPILDSIQITVVPFSQKVGSQVLTEEQISQQPKGNGHITELLKNNPNVTFSSKTGSSNTGGEISPEEISFHGAKFYNNNFTINGLSNNDNINPGSGLYGNNNTNSGINNVGLNPHELPGGGTQSIWLDADVLKSVEVFDSNISAKYGNFTGGVVNAELKDPSKHMHGKISYRTTRDDWTKFHIAPEDAEEFKLAEAVNHQPQFTKHQYGLMINQPLGDRAGMIFNYKRTSSNIPFKYKNLRDANQDTATLENTYRDMQKRLNETYLLRGTYQTISGDKLGATLTYSPHESTFVKPVVYHGRYTNTGGGTLFNLDWQKDFDRFKMKSYLAYTDTGNEIKHQSEDYRLYRLTNSIPFRANGNTVAMGGYGKYQTQKKTITLKQDFNVLPFNTGAINHHISLGWQIEKSNAQYKREKDSSIYTYVNTNINRLKQCTDECILGEQYANRRNLYYARHVKAQDDHFGAYIENKLNYKNLETNLGLRLDYSKLLGNTNISPRFSFTYDIFNDENSRVFGGASRYYSGSLLSYHLRQGITHFLTQNRTLQTDGTLSDWTTSNDGYGGSSKYATSKLDTPYSNEFVAGFSQKVYGTEWTAKWVKRENRKDFTRTKNEQGEHILTNAGSGNSESYSLNISSIRPFKTKYADIDFSLGYQHSKKTSNNTYYDADIHNESEKIIYQGQLRDSEDMPASDFHVPDLITASMNIHIPNINLNIGNKLRYEKGREYRQYMSDVNCATTTNVNLKTACADYTGIAEYYTDKVNGSKILWDMNINYKYPLWNKQSLIFDVDITNVLDKTTGLSDKKYSQGRQFWLGVAYNF